MTGIGILYITLMFLGLAFLRFGLPLLITFLIKFTCCRILRLQA